MKWEAVFEVVRKHGIPERFINLIIAPLALQGGFFIPMIEIIIKQSKSKWIVTVHTGGGTVSVELFPFQVKEIGEIILRSHKADNSLLSEVLNEIK